MKTWESLAPASRVVVAGAGMAALHTATALRERGYEGELLLVGAEQQPPYDRPPLSKEILLGHRDASPFEVDYGELGIETVLGASATGLRDGTLLTDRGTFSWNRLVIATGATPVRLPGTEGLEHVHTLRTIDDALRLRGALLPGARVAVVGAGWIGAETAWAAHSLGCEVTVVEALETPLAAALPPEVGVRFVSWYQEAGINLRLGTQVTAVRPGHVELSGGGTVPADVVVVGVGVRPATGWLAGTDIDLGPRGSVLTDERLRTSVPGVFAAGDCTAYRSARVGGSLHVEHWESARSGPVAVAANILGGDDVFDPVPYFWSQQFGAMIQYVGHHRDGDVLVWRGDPKDAKWSVCWLRDDRLVAVLAVRRPRDMVQGARLVEGGEQLDRDRVADVSVPLTNTVIG
ncbi:FAD-dependent oxidoreductase [Streptomyces sp. NPDC051572]|uniref:NAD(P)/FAD-dependent oxidoreductase n=1 Tax=unclassified Streptomyces TaxID=2593676 RepID=UPI00344FF88E